MIVCFISLSAHAAWIKVWESDASQHFVQSEPVKYKNQLANFWLLTNHNVADESGYLSYKQKIEMDCGYSQLRLIAQISYEEAILLLLDLILEDCIILMCLPTRFFSNTFHYF